MCIYLTARQSNFRILCSEKLIMKNVQKTFLAIWSPLSFVITSLKIDDALLARVECEIGVMLFIFCICSNLAISLISIVVKLQYWSIFGSEHKSDVSIHCSKEGMAFSGPLFKRGFHKQREISSGTCLFYSIVLVCSYIYLFNRAFYYHILGKYITVELIKYNLWLNN